MCFAQEVLFQIRVQYVAKALLVCLKDPSYFKTEVCPFLFCSEKVRKINLYNEGDLTHFDQKLEGFNLKRCWEECLAKSNYHSRRIAIEKFNQ